MGVKGKVKLKESLHLHPVYHGRVGVIVSYSFGKYKIKIGDSPYYIICSRKEFTCEKGDMKRVNCLKER